MKYMQYIYTMGRNTSEKDSSLKRTCQTYSVPTKESTSEYSDPNSSWAP